MDRAVRSSSSLSQELDFVTLLSPQTPSEGRAWGFQRKSEVAHQGTTSTLRVKEPQGLPPSPTLPKPWPEPHSQAAFFGLKLTQLVK